MAYRVQALQPRWWRRRALEHAQAMVQDAASEAASAVSEPDAELPAHTHTRARKHGAKDVSEAVWCDGQLSTTCAPGAGLRALPDVDAREATAEAVTDLLHDMALEAPASFWGGDSAMAEADPDEWPRGADARAFSYPWVRPRHDPGSTTTIANDHVAETARWIRQEANDPVLAAQPDMEPVPLRTHPEWPSDKPLPYPEQLARRPEEIKLIRAWCAAYDKEFKRTLKPVNKKARRRPHRFRYSVLPGGRKGLILKDFLKDEYMGFVWDCRDYINSGGVEPCKPVQAYGAQKHSEWNLDRIMQVAKDMQYPDMDIIEDLCINGFRSHSEHVGSNTVILAPNYPGFWKHPEFAAAKVNEEFEGFEKPKMSKGFLFPPFLPARLHPRSIAEHVSAETGAVKLRLTIDPGFPRTVHGTKWQPGEEHYGVAWNDGVDLQDPMTHPAVQYGSVHEYAKSVAMLKTACIPIGQTKTDVRGYFRGMTVSWDEVAYGLQWVDKAAIRADWVLAFGQSPNPQISQRISTFCETKIMLELDKLQYAWHRDNRVPDVYKPRLAAWETDRRRQRQAERQRQHAEWLRAGHTAATWTAECARLDKQQGPAARWAVGQVFVDDFMHASWSFWIHEVAAVVARVMDEFNIELADGRWDPLADGGAGAYTKNKTETVVDDAPMEILGVVVAPAGQGEKRLSPERAAKYAQLGAQLVGQPKVERTVLQSWLGRVVFAASAIVGLRTAYLAIFAALKQGWSVRGYVALSPAAWAAIEYAVALLHKNDGAALWPMRRAPGADGRQVIWTWTDAARDPSASLDQFVGYGIIIYVEGTDTVYVTNGRWTPHEQAHLCITSLELAAEEFALDRARAIIADLGIHTPVDIIQVADNKGARAVANGLSATSPALRVLLQLRSLRQDRMPGTRVTAVWAHREAMEHADASSKNDEARLRHNLQTAFGAKIRVAAAGRVTADVRNLDAAVLAARARG